MVRENNYSRFFINYEMADYVEYRIKYFVIVKEFNKRLFEIFNIIIFLSHKDIFFWCLTL